jgi:hypothetical protein
LLCFLVSLFPVSAYVVSSRTCSTLSYSLLIPQSRSPRRSLPPQHPQTSSRHLRRSLRRHRRPTPHLSPSFGEERKRQGEGRTGCEEEEDGWRCDDGRGGAGTGTGGREADVGDGESELFRTGTDEQFVYFLPFACSHPRPTTPRLPSPLSTLLTLSMTTTFSLLTTF